MDTPGTVLTVGKREENRADTVAYLMELISPRFLWSLLGCHSSKRASFVAQRELRRAQGRPSPWSQVSTILGQQGALWAGGGDWGARGEGVSSTGVAVSLLCRIPAWNRVFSVGEVCDFSS